MLNKLVEVDGQQWTEGGKEVNWSDPGFGGAGKEGPKGEPESNGESNGEPQQGGKEAGKVGQPSSKGEAGEPELGENPESKGEPGAAGEPEQEEPALGEQVGQPTGKGVGEGVTTPVAGIAQAQGKESAANGKGKAEGSLKVLPESQGEGLFNENDIRTRVHAQAFRPRSALGLPEPKAEGEN